MYSKVFACKAVSGENVFAYKFGHCQEEKTTWINCGQYGTFALIIGSHARQAKIVALFLDIPGRSVLPGKFD